MAFREKIIIQQPTEARGDAGGVEETWTTYKTVYAEIDDDGGNKDNAAEMPVFGNQMTFKIHKQDAPGVTTKMRISYSSEYWYISTRRVDRRRGFIELTGEAYDDE